MLLDVGAAGKGYLIDLVSDVLSGLGIADHVIDASGDLLARGAASERVALEHPADPTKAIGVVELHDGALGASATNRRSLGRGPAPRARRGHRHPDRRRDRDLGSRPRCLPPTVLATALFFDPSPDWVQR